jgi:hypothetical protein
VRKRESEKERKREREKERKREREKERMKENEQRIEEVVVKTEDKMGRMAYKGFLLSIPSL